MTNQECREMLAKYQKFAFGHSRLKKMEESLHVLKQDTRNMTLRFNDQFVFVNNDDPVAERIRPAADEIVLL